jgi:uncharacterized protein YaeQ
MALRATVYKVSLQLTDLDRQVFGEHSLQLACHPSETEERMMVRLLAFALEACEGLSFGRGISNDDEATLWQHDLSGALRLWVEVGLPDERLLRRASSRADRAVLYAYGGRGVSVWWEQNRDALARLGNLRVVELPQEATRALAEVVGRNMAVQVTVQDGAIWASVGERTVEIAPRELQAATR